MLSGDRQLPTPPIPNIAFQGNNLISIPTVNYRGSNLLLREIVSKLVDGNPGSCQSVFGLVNSLEKQLVAVDDFQLFLNAAHDLLILFDSAKRSSLLRAIRYSISSVQHVQCLKDEEIHYIVVNSFERESDNTMERIQALKIMDRVRRICNLKDGYPISFARSLVSIANSKEDNFRKIALESLRELSLSHTSLVAAVQGFSTLMDAVVEPVSQDIADAITHTILFLLNDPLTRKIVQPCIDLKTVLVSFTDLDSDLNDLEPRWQAAKSAFNIIMRSWVGVHTLVVDKSALPMMMDMLRDTKIPYHTQNAILDSIIEVLEPHFSRAKVMGRSKRHTVLYDDARDSPLPSSPNSQRLISGDGKGKYIRSSSDSDMVGQISATTSSSSSSLGNGAVRRPSIPQQGLANNVTRPAGSVTAPPPVNRHFSISSLFSSRGSRNSVKVPSGTAGTTDSNSNQEFTSLTSEQREVLRRASTNGRPLSTVISTYVGKSAPELPNPLGTDIEDDFSDPIFNLIDNYTALLCCAFLHVDLISSLFLLGIEGKMEIAKKSRELLVKFTKMLTNVLPENLCVDLLTNPSLIDFAATLDPKQINLGKSNRSSQMLLDIAEAFSIMPYKQTSGSHISNLSTSGAAATVSSRNRTGSMSTSKNGGNVPVNGSNKDIMNPSAIGSGPNASNSFNTLNGSNTHHANFQSLNIQSLYELAEEIKISSFSTISSLPKLTADNECTAMDVIEGLRAALTPAVDKGEFVRQMDVSRVVGKEGKEPFKWDWLTISDMLEYSFQHQDRLVEALKTKWIRRISGFYRCSTEEKGYFANLEWDPTNLQYLECASHLYSVLLHDENGMAFLTSDRRGMLFNEIARELEQLTITASSANAIIASSPAINNNGGSSPNNIIGPKNVFRLTSCTTLMAREYFTLLGRIVRTPNSRKLLDHTNIFKYLSQLGQYPSLDYVCRLIITSLSFTDGGMISKHLLQLWTTQPNCTYDNKNYYHTLLRVLLHSFAAEVEQQGVTYGVKMSTSTNANYQWCLEAIVSQLSVDDCPSDMILKSLNEAIQNRNSLKTIVSKRPKIIDEPVAQDLLIRFLAVPEGIDYVNEKGWLDQAFKEWQERKATQYVSDVEERISLALMASLVGRKGGHGSVKGSIYAPSVKASNAGRDPTLQTNMVSLVMKVIEPIPIKIPDEHQHHSGSVCSHYSNTRRMDANDSLVIDLHGFLRIPWNMELKISNQSNIVPGDNSAGEFLRIDSFLDAADMASPLSFEICSDSNRLLKVRGLVLDSKGLPTGKLISPNMTLLVTLMSGVCPVFKSGRVQPFSEGRGTGTRRRASTSANMAAAANAAANTTTGRGSVSSNGGNTTPTAEDPTLDQDMPISLGQESSYEWFLCKPSQRQGQLVQESDSNRYFLALPGEPVVFIFEKRQIQQNNQRPSRSGSISKVGGDGGNWNENGRVNSYNFGSAGMTGRAVTGLFLVEVQYYLRFETGMSVFVPMPRHMYGELSRTLDGCSHLARRSIIIESISKVRALYDIAIESYRGGGQSIPDEVTIKHSTAEIRSLLWSIGHIGSSEHGFNALELADPSFVDWCIEGSCNCSHFTIRATFFYILGLLSRCGPGARKLSRRGWDCAPHGSNSAVAFPRSPKVLFENKKDRSTSTSRTLPYGNAAFMNPSQPIAALTPFINLDGISKEQEVLNIICKMPGVILYRDCKSRLENMKKENPHLFASRHLYVEVLKILESYTFKLTARRDIIGLFSEEAKKKSPPTTSANDSSNGTASVAEAQQ